MCLGGPAYRSQIDAPQQAGMEPMTTPEARLAAIFLRDLKVLITPAEMRRFLHKNWSSVSTLAHAIHETDEQGR